MCGHPGFLQVSSGSVDQLQAAASATAAAIEYRGPDALGVWCDPAVGFALPIGALLRDPLHPWVSELLDAALLQHKGYLTPAQI